MFTNTLAILQIALQLVAAYFALRIVMLWAPEKLRWFWGVIVLGFLLMAIRRVTALLIGLDILPKLSGVVGTIDRVYLPLAISICLTIGMYALHGKFKQLSQA